MPARCPSLPLRPAALPQRRAPAWEHLGLLGPVIRGVVGDTIRVTFKNNLKEHNVSLHPHGVWYDKESEGSPYADGLPRAWGWQAGWGARAASRAALAAAAFPPRAAADAALTVVCAAARAQSRPATRWAPATASSTRGSCPSALGPAPATWAA